MNKIFLQSNSFKQIHSDNVFDYNIESKGAKIGEVVLTTKEGVNLLLDPLLNKGSGFPREERERMGLRGLLPSRIIENGVQEEVLKWQTEKLMNRCDTIKTDIEKYQFITGLQDRNEVLFYHLLKENIEKLAPIIYTPTVGEACLNYAYYFKRPRGMYFSSEDRGQMNSMVFNWHTDDVELIVVTDGSRILGLGDLGINGMGIPIGKLALYTVGAGIHPSKCLPIILDVGTNNPTLMNDTLYLGLNQKRIQGKAYDDFIDEFIRACQERFPKALIQFEDFSTENAARILNKYRNKILCFNDDMQGTATVALFGILSSFKYLGNKNPQETLKEQRIVVLGAGTAGLGVASGLLYNMKLNNLTEEQGLKNFWIVDDKGLLGSGRKVMFENQQKWVRNDCKDQMTLEEVIDHVKPTVLLGLTGVKGLFTENVIRKMANYVQRPLIFPLSNPTSRAECTAEEAYKWTNGQCIFASGSPFKPVEYNGKIYRPAQSNNMYTFPGLGLGAIAGNANHVTDNMLNACAIGLLDCVTDKEFAEGRIFPRVADIPKLSKYIALRVAQQAFKDGVSKFKEAKSDDELIEIINLRYWTPKYGSLVRINNTSY